MTSHPNLSPELNALIARVSDPANTLDMRTVRHNAVVRVVFGETGGKEIGFSFVVTKAADPDVFNNQQHSEGRLLAVNLPEMDLEKIRVRGGGDPKPGHLIGIGGGCSWNPGAPMGFSMLHVEYIDKDRWLLWQVGPVPVLLDRTVKAIYLGAVDESVKIPDALEWSYPPPKQLSSGEDETVLENRAREFFARTRTSVYQVAESVDGPLAPPLVKKIGLAEHSNIKAGEVIDDCKFVGITSKNLIFYNGTKRRPAEDVDPDAVTCWTSPIVALFLDKDEAMGSLDADNVHPWDGRWMEQTRSTLKAIGEQHPRFVVSPDMPPHVVGLSR